VIDSKKTGRGNTTENPASAKLHSGSVDRVNRPSRSTSETRPRAVRKPPDFKSAGSVSAQRNAQVRKRQTELRHLQARFGDDSEAEMLRVNPTRTTQRPAPDAVARVAVRSSATTAQARPQQSRSQTQTQPASENLTLQASQSRPAMRNENQAGGHQNIADLRKRPSSQTGQDPRRGTADRNERPRNGQPPRPGQAPRLGVANRNGSSQKKPNVTAAEKRKSAEYRKKRQKHFLERVKRSKAFRLLFLLVTMTALLLFVFTVIYNFFFRITEIEVVGITKYTEDQIILSSGTGLDSNLYSFSSETVSENIMASCPFVKSVAITRTPPNKITFEIVEENPVFYVNVFDEYYLMSASMRVLGKTGVNSADTAGLIQLKLPFVNFAVAGLEIKFAEAKNEKYVQETVTDVVASPLAERINTIDLRDRYNLTMVSDNKYKLIFGTVGKVSLRLKLAEKVFQDKMFNSENKALIDLTQLNETSVIIDNQIILD